MEATMDATKVICILEVFSFIIMFCFFFIYRSLDRQIYRLEEKLSKKIFELEIENIKRK
jgi:hypothetical protein